MESASAALPDLDRLNLAELKSLLREQHTTLQEQHAQLLSYTVEIETLKLQILKLRRMQFGNKSEKRAQQIEQLELWVEELESAAAQHSCELTKQAGTTRTPSAPKQRGARSPRISRAKRRRSRRSNHAAPAAMANSNTWAKT